MPKKPAVIAVDDDPPVLRAVERDLRRAYGRDYQVVTAGSGAAALDAIRALTLRSTPVALIVADQRMPGMTGVELLGRALELVPDAKRVLLTAYADTDAAIRAINEVRLDHYLLKPWDPPEEKLVPVLSELLDDWSAGFRPPFEGVSLVGHRWSARAHAIKDYLARNQVPYRWLDIETEPEARRLADSAGHADLLRSLVVFPDGSALSEPSNREIAAKLGRRTDAVLPFYDLAIVGGGPAALAAAVYGASEGLRTLLVEGEAAGGQAGTTSRIENYLGFPAGLSGADLARRAVAQATRLGAEILSPQDVVGLRRADPYRVLTLGDGAEVSCHTVILATGVQYRRLEVPGAAALEGIGIFYGAAISEAMACRGQDVGVVGGGNSAGQAAIHLSGFARSVTLLVRGGHLEAGMSQYLVDRIRGTANITVRTRAAVAAVEGERDLSWVAVEDVETHALERLPLAALFLFIGAVPRTGVAGRSRRARQLRVRPDRAGAPARRPAAGRLDARPGAIPARDERSRRLRRGRRPGPIGEAHRRGGRRRVDGRPVRPPVPRRPVSADATGPADALAHGSPARGPRARGDRRAGSGGAGRGSARGGRPHARGRGGRRALRGPQRAPRGHQAGRLGRRGGGHGRPGRGRRRDGSARARPEDGDRARRRGRADAVHRPRRLHRVHGREPRRRDGHGADAGPPPAGHRRRCSSSARSSPPSERSPRASPTS